jgi:hypothetical protein
LLLKKILKANEKILDGIDDSVLSKFNENNSQNSTQIINNNLKFEAAK